MSINPVVRKMSVISYGGIDDPEAGRNLTGSFHIMKLAYVDGSARMVAIDIGGHQGSDGSGLLNEQVEVIPDVVVITHAHMDHVGRLPVLSRNPGFTGKVYMSQLTQFVAKEALLDAAHILKQQFETANNRYTSTIAQIKEAWRVFSCSKESLKSAKAGKNRNSSGDSMVKSNTISRKDSRNKDDTSVKSEMTLQDAKGILRQREISSQRDIDRWIKGNRPTIAFTEEDVVSLFQKVVILPEDEFTEILPGISVRAYNAGHILGSKSMLFSIQKGVKKKVYAYFSGDLGSYRWPTKPAGEIEVPGNEFPLVFALTESTYGGTVREDFHRGMTILERDFVHCMKKKQASVFACFSLDRAQRVLHELLILQKKNGWSFPIYMDSPLALAYTSLYSMYAEDPEFRSNMKKFTPIVGKKEREALFLKKEGFRVVLTSSGMAEGGPILQYFKKWIGDEQVEFSFPGYMAENTRGWKLAINGLKVIDIPVDQKKVDKDMGGEPILNSLVVEAKINHYTHFSGHADQKDLIRWVTSLPKAKGMKLSIVHGVREGGSQSLFNTLKRKRVMDVNNVWIPELREEIVVF